MLAALRIGWKWKIVEYGKKGPDALLWCQLSLIVVFCRSLTLLPHLSRRRLSYTKQVPVKHQAIVAERTPNRRAS